MSSNMTASMHGVLQSRAQHSGAPARQDHTRMNVTF